jgi:hypothetical protein
MRFNQSISRFSIVLFLSLIVAFFIHFGYLYLFVSDTDWVNIGITYTFNLILGLSVTYVLFRLKEKYAHSLGFIFMAGSMFKFLVFFLVLQPIYKEDGEVSSLEFGFFFIPYGISLLLETLFISQVLNEADFN